MLPTMRDDVSRVRLMKEATLFMVYFNNGKLNCSTLIYIIVYNIRFLWIVTAALFFFLKKGLYAISVILLVNTNNNWIEQSVEKHY